MSRASAVQSRRFSTVNRASFSFIARRKISKISRSSFAQSSATSRFVGRSRRRHVHSLDGFGVETQAAEACSLDSELCETLKCGLADFTMAAWQELRDHSAGNP